MLNGRMAIDLIPDLKCHKINKPGCADGSTTEFCDLNCEDFLISLSERTNDWTEWPNMYAVCIPVTDPALAQFRSCQGSSKLVSQGGYADGSDTPETNPGVIQCIRPPTAPPPPPSPPQPPSPPPPPLPPPPAPPPRPPTVPGGGNTCAEFQRRWQLSIDAADSDMGYTNRQALHNQAFSRQCWQYAWDTQTVDPSTLDIHDKCENSMAQFGFTGSWWNAVWNQPQQATYPKTTDANTGYGTGTLTVTDATAFGYFNLCVSTGAGGCAPQNGATVYLDFAHPSFRWPQDAASAGINSAAPTDPNGEVTTCDATGLYAPVLTFPATATSGSEGAEAGAPETRITPADPPPPAAPPSPPAAPAPYSYTLQTLRYQPIPTAPACAQTLRVSQTPFDVLSAGECTDAVVQLALNNRDPIMIGNYSAGFRCFVNSTGVFVWSVVATGSPSGTYVCRY